MYISLYPLLAALLLAAPAAAQVPVPLSPARTLDADDLKIIFDGGRRLAQAAAPVAAQGDGFIIKPEADPPPAAPRFHLNLDAVPPELRSTIDGFDRLYHRNQEETKDWVDHINELIREKNSDRRFGKIPEWSYDGRPNEPPWVCLAYAAATANDWWALQLGRELPTYQGATTGRTEIGMDPDMLELEYYKRARAGKNNFVVPPKFIQEDPVRHTGFPYEPRGYAELLIEDEAYDVKDPITDKVHSYSPGMSAMEGEYLQLFTNSVLRSKTPAKYAKVLAEAVEKWGIVYTQLEHTEHPRWPGAHAVAVVGYFCMDEGQALIPCSRNRTDKDWGRTTYFIVHDSFGDFPASRDRDADGASAYRAVRIFSVDQAIVFPHTLKVRASERMVGPGIWRVSVTNLAGKPVKVLLAKAATRNGMELPVRADENGSLLITALPGSEVHLYIEARHYYNADGEGRTFRLKIGGEPADAVELALGGTKAHDTTPEEGRAHVALGD